MHIVIHMHASKMLSNCLMCSQLSFPLIIKNAVRNSSQ